MGMLSEKTQRAIDKYFVKLVRRQPTWLRDMFEADQIVFEIDPNGILGISIDEGCDDFTKSRARTLIGKYLTKNPIDFINQSIIN